MNLLLNISQIKGYKLDKPVPLQSNHSFFPQESHSFFYPVLLGMEELVLSEEVMGLRSDFITLL